MYGKEKETFSLAQMKMKFILMMRRKLMEIQKSNNRPQDRQVCKFRESRGEHSPRQEFNKYLLNGGRVKQDGRQL